MTTNSMNEAKKLIVSLKPQSAIAEQFRSIRTSIEFSTEDQDCQVTVITSSEQNSGKSLVSSNLALTFSQKGEKTLLIDADMRNPSIKNYFYIPSRQGLSSVIRNKANVQEYIFETNEKNLFILPAGITPPNPADLLGSISMKNLIQELRESFDHIIIDTPPVLAVTDAILVSAFADGVVLVIRSGKTTKQNAKKVIRLLNQSSTPIIGSILNDVKMKLTDYYYQNEEE